MKELKEEFLKKYTGLDAKKIEASRKEFGENVVEATKKESFLVKILNTFKEPMFILLLITASIYFFLGEYNDGFIMLLFVLVICIIEFFEEQRTDKAIEELNKLSSLNVKVIRESKYTVIDSKEVVVGDIVLLEEGDKVPADGVILECEGLGADESLLTGESKVIYKSNKKDAKNHYKTNCCYEGTVITNGTAVVKITAVGVNTEFGKIGQRLTDIKKESTPLEKQINRFVIICTAFSIAFFVLVVFVNFISNSGVALNERFISSILSGITIAMATIPEEIPVVLTVFLCLGSLKLSKENTLTRNNKSIETLSAMTVLCTDKTGTLTENKMVVEKTDNYSDDNLKVASLACEKNPYDPMEIAIKRKFKNERLLEEYNLEYEYIFSSEDKMVGKLWNDGESRLLCVKGAYESILPLCKLNSKTLNDVTKKIDEYSKEGYRVLAVAKKVNVKKVQMSLKDYSLDFCGLIALSDPPRKGVKESIKKCETAGIRVIMITGDSGDTAVGIAKKLGIQNNSEYLTGTELENLSNEELKEKVRTVNIFARVYPEHKMRIVEALQQNGEVVAMTGDGINDAPALKKADIGISMGKRGTNVAKESADIILLDDNFNTIVSAIQNGRCIYSNIRKSISYILAIHIPIALIALLTPILKIPNLLLPVHIVLLELLLDPTSSIIFQRIEPDDDIMKKSPRKKDENIITLSNVLKCIVQGVIVFAVVLLTYYFMLKTGYSLALSSTISFTILLVSIILIAFNLKNDELTIKNLLLSYKDKVVIAINCISIIILLLFIYLPFSHETFNTCSLNIKEWLVVIVLSLVTILPMDIIKVFNKKKKVEL